MKGGPAKRHGFPNERAAYTISEVANLLGRHRMTVHRMLERGALRAVVIPGGRRMVSAASLERLLKTAEASAP